MTRKNLIPVFLFLFLFLNSYVVFAAGLNPIQVEGVTESVEMARIKADSNTLKIGTKDPIFISDYGNVRIINGSYLKEDNVSIGEGIIAVQDYKKGLAEVTFYTGMPNTPFSIKSYDGITSDKRKVRTEGNILYNMVYSDENGYLTYTTNHFSTQIADFPNPLTHDAGGETTTYYLDYFFTDYDFVESDGDGITEYGGSTINRSMSETDPEYEDSQVDVYFQLWYSNPRWKLTSKNYTAGFSKTIYIRARDIVSNNTYVEDSFEWVLTSGIPPGPSVVSPLPNFTMYQQDDRVIFINDYFTDYDSACIFLGGGNGTEYITTCADMTLFDHGENLTNDLFIDIDGLGDDIGIHAFSNSTDAVYSGFIVVYGYNNSYAQQNFSIEISGTQPTGGGGIGDYFFYDDAEGGVMSSSYNDLSLGAYSTVNPYNGSRSIQINTSANVDLDNDISPTNFSSDEYSTPYCLAYNAYSTQLDSVNSESGIIFGSWASALIHNRNAVASNNDLTLINDSAYVSITSGIGQNTWANITICFTNGYAASGLTTAIVFKNGINYVNTSFIRSRLNAIGLHNRQPSSGIMYIDNIRIWNYSAYGSEGPVGDAYFEPPSQIANIPNIEMEYDELLFVDFDDFFTGYDAINITFTDNSSITRSIRANISTSSMTFNSTYLDMLINGDNFDINLYITSKFAAFNTTFNITAYNQTAGTSDTVTFTIGAPVIEPIPPSKINNIDNINMLPNETETLNFGAYFTNYETILLNFIDPTDNSSHEIETDIGGSSSEYDTSNIFILLLSAGSNVNATIEGTNETFYIVLTAIARNAYGEVNDSFSVNLEYPAPEPEPEPTALETYFSAAAGIFPEADDLTFKQRIIAIVIIMSIFIIGGAFINNKTGTDSSIIIILMAIVGFILCIGLGYLPLGLVLAVLGVAAILFIVKNINNGGEK